MATPEQCASCPIQCLLAERITTEEQTVQQHKMRLDLLTSEEVFRETEIGTYYDLLDDIKQQSSALAPQVEGLRAQFAADYTSFNERAERMRTHLEEHIAWEQYDISRFQLVGKAVADRCIGPVTRLAPAAEFVDRQPRSELRCTGTSPDVLRLFYQSPGG